MDISTALKTLEEFCFFYENAKKLSPPVTQNFIENLKYVKSDYEATKILLNEYKFLVKEATNLSIEIVQREIKLAQLECKVIAFMGV